MSILNFRLKINHINLDNNIRVSIRFDFNTITASILITSNRCLYELDNIISNIDVY